MMKVVISQGWSKREDYDSREDGYEVDPDKNEGDVLVEDVNEIKET